MPAPGGEFALRVSPSACANYPERQTYGAQVAANKETNDIRGIIMGYFSAVDLHFNVRLEAGRWEKKSRWAGVPQF